MLTTILIIWFLLGIHSCYYFINVYTEENDFPMWLSPILIICLIAPIITHLATFIVFDEKMSEKILIKKKRK